MLVSDYNYTSNQTQINFGKKSQNTEFFQIKAFQAFFVVSPISLPDDLPGLHHDHPVGVWLRREAV